MGTPNPSPNNFRHSDHLSELIESMKNDALEQAKKDKEKRRRKAKREYRKTQRFIEKEDLKRQIKINKSFDKLLKREKKTATKRWKREIRNTADQFRKRRKQIEINARKATREVKTWRSESQGGEETAEGGFGLEDRSPEVEEGITKAEEERESTGETRRAEPQD